VLDLAFHLIGFREAAEFVLGEDQLAIDADVEDAIFAADELGLYSEALLQGRSQTGRARVVVSRYAPRNRDLHRSAPHVMHYTAFALSQQPRLAPLCLLIFR
jgi:hypothetical protein